LLENSDGNGWVYDIVHTEHVVSEELPFIDIGDIFEEIVISINKRFEKRKAAIEKSMNPSHFREMDKIHNHLTVLSNTKGMGKSTAMVHLPLSQAYKNYHMKRVHCPLERLKVSDESPIVCALTYNSGMEGVSQSLGIRILYGTFMTMGCRYKHGWPQFCKEFKDY